MGLDLDIAVVCIFLQYQSRFNTELTDSRMKSSKMKSSRILLFGDLSFTFEDDLKALLHVRDNPLLTSFFEQTGARLRDEIGSLGIQQQKLFPHFTTLIDLVSKLGETEGTPVLRFCVLSVCQVGQFIKYVTFIENFEC